MIKYFLLVFTYVFLLFTHHLSGQVYSVKGKVIDAETREPLAFVNIVINDGDYGDVTDIDGKFSLQYQEPIHTLRLSYVGYESIDYSVPENASGLIIRLREKAIELSEVVIVPGINPAHRIIRLVVEQRDKNDPKKLASYAYTAYDKMYFTVALDTLEHHETVDSGRIRLEQFLAERYFFMMETVSRKKFLHPDLSREDVIASRVSGFQDPIITFLISQMQSTSFYDEMIMISDKIYINPISRGSFTKYYFALEDTLFLEGSADTTFVISFRPFLNRNFDGMKGLLYINSNGYAIQNVIAEPARQESGISMKIQQMYKLIDGKQWFPVQLNTDIIIGFIGVSTQEENHWLTGIGRSYIEEIRIEPELVRKEFGNAGIEIHPMAYKRDENFWNLYRNDSLTLKEAETYHYIDSIGKEYHFDEVASSAIKISKGKIPWKIFDFDLRRSMGYNGYEGFSLGLGINTNEKVSRRFETGGYWGYGFRDKNAKYGGYINILADRGSNLSFSLRYSNDVQESGGVHFFDDYNKFRYEEFRDYLLMKMDRAETMNVAMEFRAIKYARVHFGISRIYLEPGYDYYYGIGGDHLVNMTNRFHFAEIMAGIRYSYREKLIRNPLSSISLGTRYPVFWLQYTRGFDQFLGGGYSYNRLDLKIEDSFYTKYLGETRSVLKAGFIFDAVPYPLLFNGNGSYHRFTVFAPTSFTTMRMNEFYSDLYVALYLTHDFGKLLVRGKWFDPQIAIATNIGFGSLVHSENHYQVSYKTMEQGYYESGIILDEILNFRLVTLGFAIFYRYGPYSLGTVSHNFAYRFTLSFPKLF